ncbi:MAG TPA: endonuclease [Candidatus Edwardsbacteria bacterium]|nr:endonuclease [Candidatus Edwardsbacteria bacterium]
MRKNALTVAMALLAMTQVHAATIYPGLMGKPLIDSLVKYYKPTSTLGYDKGRDTIYGEIDIVGDSLRCVYTGLWIHGGPTSAPRTWISNNGFNCEHTWPQSQLPTQAVSDMQHMYPTESNVNNARSNYPFAELTDANTYAWYRYDHYNPPLYAAPSSGADEYSKYNQNTSFEPRDDHKGEVARAMYYILTMYMQCDTMPDSTWWQAQKDTLYKWHCTHVATAAESTRTSRVAMHQQGRINPFIADSTLIRRCYFPSIPTNTQVGMASTALTKNEGDGTFNLTVNIANPSGSSATTVQVVLTGGTGSAADVNNYTTQTLTFPAGSSSPQSAAVTITDDALVENVETIVFTLRNVSGGSSAAIGADSVFTLSIIDNDRTTVGFSPAAISKTEGNAPFNITVAIANPSGSAATTADVVLASGSGSAADINGYTTQTVTFPAGSSASQNVAITITDDALVEGTETLVFKLRNVSGGSSAAAGADSAFTLTLYDNDAASGTTFLFEPFDYTAGDSINGIHNWTLHSGTTNPLRVVTPGLTYGGYKGKAVTNACSLTTTGEDANRAFTSQTSGTVYASFLVSVDSAQTTGDYFFHLSTATLNTSFFAGRVYARRDASNNLAFGLSKLNEAATYTAYDYARRTVYALVLKYKIGAGTQDDSVSLFVISTAMPGSEPATPTIGPLGFASTDPASIGTVALRQGAAANAPVLKLDDIKIGSAWSSAPLAVALSSFGCAAGNGAIELRWRTESETNSYRWIIERAGREEGPYAKQAELAAAGNSGQPRDYQWSDHAISGGNTYYYRLGQQDLSGAVGYFGPVSATAPLAPSAVGLQACPNPFSAATTIRYQLAGPHKVDLRIYNAAGQLVRTIADAPGNAGGNSAEWDGRDGRGRAAVPGVYFYRLAAGTTSQLGRVVLVR